MKNQMQYKQMQTIQIRAFFFQGGGSKHLWAWHCNSHKENKANVKTNQVLTSGKKTKSPSERVHYYA